ncbi:MAG: hydroxymethylbilane synthase [Gammaproteobacteria bacterium]|nr:hydroxymethylbilane synthase [Gammaproteobacteria bacterium]
MNSLRIATRRSPLALWQTQFVAQALKNFYPKLAITLVPIQTQGDKKLAPRYAEESGKGLFTKELEGALLKKKADIAVHSVKDLPGDLPSDLKLAVILAREDPRDVYVSHRYPSIEACPPNTRIGTSSLRRQSQLKSYRSDLTFISLHGNVGTRLLKLQKGTCDALILAYAGLKRLGIENDYPIQLIPLNILLPAPGQGAIGIECRADDIKTQTLITPLQDPKSACSILAERSLSRHLGGGCQVPLAAFAFFENKTFCLKGGIGHLQAERKLKTKEIPTTTEAEELGRAVAEDLLQQGARALLCP